MKLPRRRSVAGEEEDNELRCSGAKEKGRMGSGDARGGNKYGSTVNLDMDQRLWRILELEEMVPFGAPVAKRHR